MDTMKKLLIVAILAAAIVGGVLWYVGHAKTSPQTVTAIRGTVVSKVSITGKTKAVKSVDLGFQVGGKVATVTGDVGTEVSAGDTLVTLDSAELQANLLQAAANRDSEEAKLTDLQNGTTPQDVAIAQAQLASAQGQQRDAQQALADALTSAYTGADDSVHTDTDGFFTNPRTDPHLIFDLTDSQLAINIRQARQNLEPMFSAWSALSAATSSEALVATVNRDLLQIQAYTSLLAQAVNSLSPTSVVSQTTISGYKATVSQTRSTISGLISSVQAAAKQANDADDAVDVATKQLAAKQAGNTPDAIRAQTARVSQFAAQMATIQAQLAHTSLVSPISGQITRQDAKVGQIVSAAQTLVSVMTEGNFEIDGYVPEINVGKIAKGDAASVTFDAFPGETFDGTLLSIDPAETVIDGITNFKVVIILAKKDSRLRNGLTANVDVVGQQKNDVVILPSYAIVQRADGTYVEKYVGTTIETVPVSLGLIGQDKSVEVVSGVTPGDVVVIPFATQ